MMVDKSTLRIVVYSCLVETCRWHRMTAHPPSGRPYSGLKNGAGLKVKNKYNNKNCAIRDIVRAPGTLSLTESFLYVHAQASHCSCPPYPVHRLPGKNKIMSADSIQSPPSSQVFVYRLHVRCPVPVYILNEHNSRVFIDFQDA